MSTIPSVANFVFGDKISELDNRPEQNKELSDLMVLDSHKKFDIAHTETTTTEKHPMKDIESLRPNDHLC